MYLSHDACDVIFRQVLVNGSQERGAAQGHRRTEAGSGGAVVRGQLLPNQRFTGGYNGRNVAAA
jgi:hypothetical protein